MHFTPRRISSTSPPVVVRPRQYRNTRANAHAGNYEQLSVSDIKHALCGNNPEVNFALIRQATDGNVMVVAQWHTLPLKNEVAPNK